MTTRRAAVILAAGQGTRMKSDLPKVMHPVGGRAMLDWSIALARSTGCERIVVVSSPLNAAVNQHVARTLGEDALAIQSPALGTAHAVRAAEAAFAGFAGDLVVLYGDAPLIPASAVEAAFAALNEGGDVVVLGFEAANPGAYGRLILGADGRLERIVEAKDASPAELAVSFCNSGVVAARCSPLFALLAQVRNDNAKGEFYLTDVVGLANAAGGRALAIPCDEADVLGVNSRAELASAEAQFQARRRLDFMQAGVTLIAPETVYFAHDTEIARDVVIEPHVFFGPGVRVGEGARIRAFSHLEGAVIGPASEVGPFVRLRKGAVLERAAKIGNFVEVKNVHVGEGAKASHLSYLGDGRIGAHANIGAGTIFCNYDGYEKHETHVGAGAFIGSNSALVAPVRIGDGAMVGSGSVVIADVPDDALALTRCDQVNKPGWAKRFREAKMMRKAGKATS